MTKISNALTIDVEDYYQVSAFEDRIPMNAWTSLPSRVERNVDLILSVLGEYRVHATFFTLGWIAERHRALVRRIVDGGHEIASHGYAHRRACEQSPFDFYNDVVRSKAILEDLTGYPVQGYRAPSFSIGNDNLWALDLLARAGYRYSSSIYPIRHDHYGMPDAPRFAFYPDQNREILEIPITTVRLFWQNVPAGGGGYFRVYPYALSRWLIEQVNVQERMPSVFYFHPWELDPGQPRQRNIGWKAGFRHYVNLHRTESRVRALVRDFVWDRMDNIFLRRA